MVNIDLKEYVNKIVYDPLNKIIYYVDFIDSYSPDMLVCEVLKDLNHRQIKGKRYRINYKKLKIIKRHLFFTLNDISSIIKKLDDNIFNNLTNKKLATVYYNLSKNLKDTQFVMLDQMNVNGNAYFMLWNDLYREYEDNGL